LCFIADSFQLLKYLILNLQIVKLGKQVSLLEINSGPDLSSKFQEKVHEHTGLEAIELLGF
jgi:hypothetical protein